MLPVLDIVDIVDCLYLNLHFILKRLFFDDIQIVSCFRIPQCLDRIYRI